MQLYHSSTYLSWTPLGHCHVFAVGRCPYFEAFWYASSIIGVAMHTHIHTRPCTMIEQGEYLPTIHPGPQPELGGISIVSQPVLKNIHLAECSEHCGVGCEQHCSIGPLQCTTGKGNTNSVTFFGKCMNHCSVYHRSGNFHC